MIGVFIMDKLSRTKKYEDLRKQIQQDSETEIKTEKLSEYANKLNELDKNSFKKMEVNANTNYEKSHNRKTLINTSEHSVIKEDMDIKEYKEKVDIDEGKISKYIEEVKEYNKDKGLLSDTDTQLNIINTIRKTPNKNIIRPFGDIDLDKGVDFSVNSMSKKDLENDIKSENFMDEQLPEMDLKQFKKSNTISLEIGNILKELEESDVINTTAVCKKVIAKELEMINTADKNDKEVVNPVEDDVKKEDINIVEEEVKKEDDIVENDEEINDEEVLEEKEIINEEEIETVQEFFDDSIEEYNNKDGVINFIIVILVILLLVVIGIFIYFLLMNKGVI
jgi:hypothetical protein